jgi:Ca2+-binding EF-hand superfamily protein
VFDTLDSNSDGVIDEMELNDVILSMYQARTARPAQPRADPFTPT